MLNKILYKKIPSVIFYPILATIILGLGFILAGFIGLFKIQEVGVFSPPAMLKNTKVATDKYAFTSKEGDIIEIGRSSLSSSHLYLKLNKWGGEASLKVSIPYTAQSRPLLAGNKLLYSNAKQLASRDSLWHKIVSTLFPFATADQPTQPRVDVAFYPKQPEQYIEADNNGNRHTIRQNENGGVEFDTILYDKPVSNVIRYPIETKGLKFFYQPPLTEEITKEQKEQGYTATDTAIYNKDGKEISYRPENVVGSYAVYHESKAGDYSKIGGKNYRAGKAFHIYRPKIIDANGKWIWGELNIDEQSGTLTITIDQNWLDNAVYPVKVDPTFGYETVGATGDYYEGGNIILGSVFTISENGKANSITAYLAYGYNNSKCALYLHDDSSLVGGTQELTSIDNEPPDWTTWSFEGKGPSLNSNTDYVIVIWNDDDISLYYDSGDTDKGRYQNQTYGVWPDLATFTHNNNKYSIYCTYVEAPNVTTNDVSVIKDTEATGNGSVTAINDTSITERGFVYDTTSHSYPSDVAPSSSGYASYVNETGFFSTGTFSLTLISLTKGSTYYVRAYAKNNKDSGHYAYGDEVSFIAGEIKRIDTTNADFDAGTHSDTRANNNNLELVPTGYLEGFEGTFPPSGWTTGGSANWFKSTNQAHGGSYSAEGEDITDDQSTYIEWTAPATGTLSFWWKVSSENDYDWLRFKINGTEQFKISGEVDWQQKTGISVNEGDTLRWEYTKDFSDSEGSDTGWIDDIHLYIGGSAYKTSGTYTSASLDISNLYSVDDSQISWNATLNGQTLNVYTRYSTDGGSNWSFWVLATNGGAMSGVNSIGTNTSNALVQYKVEMSGDGNNTPQLHDITMRIIMSTGEAGNNPPDAPTSPDPPDGATSVE